MGILQEYFLHFFISSCTSWNPSYTFHNSSYTFYNSSCTFLNVQEACFVNVLEHASSTFACAGKFSVKWHGFLQFSFLNERVLYVYRIYNSCWFSVYVTHRGVCNNLQGVVACSPFHKICFICPLLCTYWVEHHLLLYTSKGMQTRHVWVGECFIASFLKND